MDYRLLLTITVFLHIEFVCGISVSEQEVSYYTSENEELVPGIHLSDESPVHIVSRRDVPGPNETIQRPQSVFQDNHVYYNRTVAINHPLSVFYTLEFNRIFNTYPASRHGKLDNGQNTGVPVQLTFPFDFYGHPVTNIVVTTGGFLYVNEITHPYLPFSQYIAPLMANFRTQSDISAIKYVQTEKAFWVRWENLLLQSNSSLGNFSFQCVFFSNGSIVFDYIAIPISMEALKAASPSLLKVGLSDAFYYDVRVPELGTILRKIVKYHDLSIPLDNVVTDGIIQLIHLPTCNQQSTCQDCTNKTRAPSFNCSWCYELGRCSSGVDRQVQAWVDSDCHFSGVVGGCGSSKFQPLQQQQQQSATRSSVVLGVCLGVLALILVSSLVGFLLYGYRHPESSVGIWLIEHRPSRLFGRHSGGGGSGGGGGAAYKIGGDSPYVNFSNA